MRTIRFRVNQQRIKNVDSILHVYQGTDNYLKLQFEFGKDWDDCVIGIAFGSKSNPKLPCVLKDNCCVVPQEAFDKDRLGFYLLGKKPNYRIESQEFYIEVGE